MVSGSKAFEKFRVPYGFTEPEYQKYIADNIPPSPPSPIPPWVRMRLLYSQKELDDILKSYPTVQESYAFLRHEAEVIAAASIGRAPLPWDRELPRSCMEVSHYKTCL